MVRYYRQVGLLPFPPRSGRKQWLVGHEDVRWHASMPAFFGRGSLCRPYETVGSWRCVRTVQRGRGRLSESTVRGCRARIECHQALRRELERMIEQSRGGSIADCPTSVSLSLSRLHLQRTSITPHCSNRTRSLESNSTASWCRLERGTALPTNLPGRGEWSELGG